MKKNGIFVDMDNNRLVMTKAYYKKACVFGTEEYYALRKAKAENKGLEVVFKGHLGDRGLLSGGLLGSRLLSSGSDWVGIDRRG